MSAELLGLLFATVLSSNIALLELLGVCPLLGTSRRFESALAVCAALAVALLSASLLCHLLWRLVLQPLELGYLRTLSFLLLIATIARIIELALRKHRPLLFQALGLYVPLIGINGAVLGVALINSERGHDLAHALVYSLGAAAGYTLVFLLFSAMRERVALADVPAPFQGAAISLLSAGLMSLAFMGFAGLA